MSSDFIRLLPTAETTTAVATEANLQTVVLVPSESVLLASAALPEKVSRSMAKQAAPFAVEELLSEDPGELHFAYPAKAPFGNLMPMAICHPDSLKAWQEIYPDAHQMIPDILALPLEEDHWTLFLEPERFLLRLDDFSGFAGELENLDFLLTATATAQGWPRGIRILGAIERWPEPELPCPSTSQVGDFDDFAAVDPNRNINLLQGPFQPRHQGQNDIKSWWPVALMACLLWLASSLHSKLEVSRLEALSEQAQTDIRQAYTDIMPKGSRYVEGRARARVEQYLIQQQGSSSASSLLFQLNQVAGLMGRQGEHQFQQLSYRDQQLEFQLRTKDMRFPEQLVNQLNQKGLKAQLKQLNLDQGTAMAIIGLSAP